MVVVSFCGPAPYRADTTLDDTGEVYWTDEPPRNRRSHALIFPIRLDATVGSIRFGEAIDLKQAVADMETARLFPRT